ncbi:MAG: phosphotransferase [Acidimicrobiales bacterium]
MTNVGAIDPAALIEPLRQYLPRQRWYGASDTPASVTVRAHDVLEGGSPALLEEVIDADGARYQALLGLRPAEERPDFLRGRDDALLGEVGRDGGNVVAYDAVIDPVLGLLLLDKVSGGAEAADHVRPVSAEQSNSSLVYDNRLILKVFRRLHPGRNLEVEMTQALADGGFDHVARPLAVFSRTYDGEEYDLAVLQPFLMGGTDGWALALTSLRDLFGVGDTQPVPVISADMPPPDVDPAMAGGDFSAEAHRLGVITAEMHMALAEAFGVEPGDGGAWAASIEAEMHAVEDPEFDRAGALRLVDALRRARDAGPAIRVHGDYHLGQVLRTDSGWFVLDFEGEPARSPDERRRRFSPLRDVAGMFRSFHYASEVAQIDRGEDCDDLASKWEDRNRDAYLDGYVQVAEKARLLPSDPATMRNILDAFELEKAIYEHHYEHGHRPDWVHIPTKALKRLAGEA